MFFGTPCSKMGIDQMPNFKTWTHWTTGLLNYWTTGPLDYWTTGLLDYWIAGLLDYWATGLLNYRTTELLLNCFLSMWGWASFLFSTWYSPILTIRLLAAISWIKHFKYVILVSVGKIPTSIKKPKLKINKLKTWKSHLFLSNKVFEGTVRCESVRKFYKWRVSWTLNFKLCKLELY